MSGDEISLQGSDASNSSNPNNFKLNVTTMLLNTSGTLIRNSTATLLENFYNMNSNNLMSSHNSNRIANGTDAAFLSTINGGDNNLRPPDMDAGVSERPTTFSGQDSLGLTAIVGLSLLFFVIVLVGLVGNALVIFVILADRKMRQSVTNLLILNLAAADLVIMAFGVPEIVQFMMDRGWLLGLGLCRMDRFLLVVCLYCSVLSLVSVCIER